MNQTLNPSADSAAFLKTAREVIALERDGLDALSAALRGDLPLGQSFVKAVDLIKSARGRIIVSGMGKSGHIGRKIAATLASTGEPASFVHPGEASHGDLGMISKDDIVLALSNSGETAELSDIIGYCGRFDIPLMAITSGTDSTLGQAADICLGLPKCPEACGETRAPTTSTTMTLALGDALCVALLRDKGFQASDFKNFHPGGKLGAALRKVSDIMARHDRLPLCAPDDSIADVTQIIARDNFGCVGIVEGEALVGVITDGDLRRALTPDLMTKTASDVMTRNPVFVTEDTLAADALGLLTSKHITALFVCRDNRPVGLVHIHDMLSLGVA